MDTTLNTTSRWKSIVAHWEHYRDSILDRAPETTQVMHDNLVTEIVRLVAQVGDTSNLILDPELDSYYLMDIVINQVPRMLRNSESIRGLVTTLDEPTQTNDTRDEWLRLQESIQAALSQTDRGIQIASTHNKNLPLTLRALRLEATFHNNAFLELIDRISHGRPLESHEHFMTLSDRAIMSQLNLYDATLPLLDKLLEKRLQSWKQRQQQIQLFAVLVLSALTGILIIFSQALERQQKSEAAVEAAKAASQAKSIFLSNMSHELRTPLNIILGFTQLVIRGGSLNPKQEEYMATINRSGEHLLMLINDVLEMSKIEAGRITLNKTDFDLSALLDWAYDMFQFKAQSQGLQLLLERANDLPHFIRTDENKLRQVLVNLLGNAVKFTQTGSVALRVRLKSGTPDRQWELESPPTTTHQEALLPSCTLEFEVEDTGPGIAPADHDRLFQPFVQADAGYRSQEGTGLGLAISQKFVNLMGGEIWVSSTLGHGSLFRFTIHAQLPPTGTRPVFPHPQTIIGLAPGQPQYRILVVDDKADNRRILLELLAPVGFAVQEASNGEEAIAEWEAWSPDLIWMDIRMPVMDGYEATRRIKAACTKRSQDFPIIIALTGSVFEQDRKVALESGCRDFVRKPFRTEDIFEKLTEHLGVHYVYANPSGLDNLGRQQSPPTPLPIAPLVPADLSVMPQEWIEDLQQAALKVNASLILSLIKKIPPKQAQLASSIQHLVDDFYFEEIVELCDQYFQRSSHH